MAFNVARNNKTCLGNLVYYLEFLRLLNKFGFFGGIFLGVSKEKFNEILFQ